MLFSGPIAGASPAPTSFQTGVRAGPIGKSIRRFFVQDLRKVKFKTFSSKKGGVSANYFEKFDDSTSMQDVLAN
jgi:hypothetical protein